MLIINNRKPAKQPTIIEAKADMKAAFAPPRDYVTGALKKLRHSTSIDWWLNVDYVESESALS
ncbi:hypothetical protein [Litorivivens sp.]|uniref:hypothetical protein n=1 Tax=Litorivivens sp. TaxID=2020868 RepID=UPI00356B4961